MTDGSRIDGFGVGGFWVFRPGMEGGGGLPNPGICCSPGICCIKLRPGMIGRGRG